MSDYDRNIWDLSQSLKGLPPDEFNRKMNAGTQPVAINEWTRHVPKVPPTYVLQRDGDGIKVTYIFKTQAEGREFHEAMLDLNHGVLPKSAGAERYWQPNPTPPKP